MLTQSVLLKSKLTTGCTVVIEYPVTMRVPKMLS